VIELLSGLALVITSLATIGPAARAIGDGFGFLWPGGVVGVLVGLCLMQAFLHWRRSILAASEPSRDGQEQGVPNPALRQTETVEHSPVARLERGPTDTSEAFGNRLRELRVQRGITQEDLAREANLHPVQIGRVERGLGAPRLTTILRLARGLNVEPSELLSDDSESVASSG
jgi:ribosome-binding protein aMBF1 (putative translation factor)